MSLVTSKEMLSRAQAEGYAIGAFNAENMEMVLAIVEAAEELCSPVMIQTTPSTVKYASTDVYASMARAVAENATVPVCVHLDHGNSYELVEKALRSGYTSVMIDGSLLDFEENIRLTRSVVDAAGTRNIPVEAELGSVGGKEDSLEAEGGYTVPEEARTFVEKTGVFSLAVAIGTAHGVYRNEPRLDVERLARIRDMVDIPLVLHGASGLSDDSIRACIREGICKVNFATELRQAYTAAVRSALAVESVYDPKVYGKAARQAVKEQVMNRILVCGCQGKA